MNDHTDENLAEFKKYVRDNWDKLIFDFDKISFAKFRRARNLNGDGDVVAFFKKHYSEELWKTELAGWVKEVSDADQKETAHKKFSADIRDNWEQLNSVLGLGFSTCSAFRKTKNIESNIRLQPDPDKKEIVEQIRAASALSNFNPFCQYVEHHWDSLRPGFNITFDDFLNANPLLNNDKAFLKRIRKDYHQNDDDLRKPEVIAWIEAFTLWKQWGDTPSPSDGEQETFRKKLSEIRPLYAQTLLIDCDYKGHRVGGLCFRLRSHKAYRAGA
jgi:hypothetical protein